MEGLFARYGYRDYWAMSLMFKETRGSLYDEYRQTTLYTTPMEVRCSPKCLIKW